MCIAYPEMDEEQVVQQSIKEIRQALSDQSQTLIWELSQQPQTTIRDVAEVIQRFDRLQRATPKVNALATAEVRELKAQVAEQAELLKALVTSQTTLQRQLQQRLLARHNPVQPAPTREARPALPDDQL